MGSKKISNKVMSELLAYLTAKAITDEDDVPATPETLKELYPNLAEFIQDAAYDFDV